MNPVGDGVGHAGTLETAGRLFAARGHDATRLDDVAAAAGVTKPILYRHFDGKRALYLALLERHRDDLSSFAGVIPSDGSIEERLRALLDVWLAYVETHSYAWTMLFRDTGGGPEIHAFRMEVHARARLVLVGMASLVLWWIDNPSVPRRTILDAMTRVWSGLFGPDP